MNEGTVMSVGVALMMKSRNVSREASELIEEPSSANSSQIRKRRELMMDLHSL